MLATHIRSLAGQPVRVLGAEVADVPYIGPVLAAIPAIAVGALHSIQRAIVVALSYLVLQQIENCTVTPNVMHSQTDIRPATVIVAITPGYAIGGILGASAAIPIFAAARVLLNHVIAPAVREAAATELSRSRAGHR